MRPIVTSFSDCHSHHERVVQLGVTAIDSYTEVLTTCATLLRTKKGVIELHREG